jgi:hypothetical protein
MANPTTNYGFVLPTSTDLVTDLPADFDVALQGVDTRLKALQPGTTLGDIAYSSATANTNTRLGIGTTGQVLTVASGVPSWSTPAGGGKVLQVVNATYNTTTTSTTDTYADTGLTATITPTSATSKVLVLVSQNGCGKLNNNSAAGLSLRLMRGATAILEFGRYVAFTRTVVENNVGSTSATYLDSPATTSATTYKTQQASSANAGSVFTQVEDEYSSITLIEIGA